MTPERWQQIKAAFQAVDDALPQERPRLLAELEPELRGDVEKLLGEQLTGSIIEHAIGEQAAKLTSQERFGHYQITRRVGHGGMGAVFEAARVDDFHKKVALKIIKQEFDSDYARARFQQERQLLAVLEHPNIARLLDGGESDAGSPYLVLEFVDGIPIDQYAAKLPIGARLQLFLKVCGAVEYAHRNLIIHRDLKPANILVTGAGEPKLLDFGIAKLLDPSASKTQTGFQALTPDYASPEQVRGLAITTASDVYSLGVVLYQLLTNRKPYQVTNVTAFELDQIVNERAPDPPGLKGELDNIILMALRKEPERRYGSVLEFAQDIERYLEHRPVAARKDTGFYRVRKYVRRNRAVLAGTALALLAIVGFAAQAVRSGIRADAEAAVSREVVDFLKNDLLGQATPDLQPDPHVEVRTALDRAAQRIGDRFRGRPRVEASLRRTIAESYIRLGLYKEARPHLESAAKLLTNQFGPGDAEGLGLRSALAESDSREGRPRDAEAVLPAIIAAQTKALGKDHPEVLDSMDRLGAALVRQGKLTAAERVFTAVVAGRKRALGVENKETLSSQNNLAALYYYQDRYEDAARNFGEAVAALSRVVPAENPTRLSAETNLATCYGELGRFDEAQRLFEQIIAVRTRVMGPDHPDTLASVSNLGTDYYHSGHFVKAEEMLEQLVRDRRRVLGPDHPETLNSMHALSATYLAQRKFSEALSVAGQTLETRLRVLGPRHRMTIRSMVRKGRALTLSGRAAEGIALAEKAAHEARSIEDPKGLELLQANINLAELYWTQDRLPEAEALLKDAVAKMHAKIGAHINTLYAANDLALVQLKLGNASGAAAMMKTGLAEWEGKDKGLWGRHATQALLGAALPKNDAEGERLLLAAYEGLSEHRHAIPAEYRFLVDSTVQWLIELYEAEGKSAKIDEWKVLQKTALK